MFSWTWSVELSMALCKLEMFNLAINADDLFYFFKIFEVVNIWKSWMKTAGWRITWKMIFFHIILHPVVLIYDFHIFITLSSSFHGFITNQFNNLQPVGLLAQLVECCTSIAEVKGSNSAQAWIFSGFLFASAKVASTTVMIFFHTI